MNEERSLRYRVFEAVRDSLEELIPGGISMVEVDGKLIIQDDRHREVVEVRVENHRAIVFRPSDN